MQGVSAVYHCAALVSIGWKGEAESWAVNVEGSLNVGRAAMAEGARMVHASSIDALGLGTPENPVTEETPYTPHVPCPYAVTKRAAEVALLELAEEGLDLVIINPGFMLGAWDWHPSSGRMLLEIAAGKAIVAPRGVNQFCDAAEVAQGAITACRVAPAGERYIMTGELMTYLDAFRLFAEITGGRKPFFSLGPLARAIGSLYGDVTLALTGQESDINSAAIAMTRLPRYFSHAKAEKELGYASRPVRESAQLAWSWFLQYGFVPQQSDPVTVQVSHAPAISE